MSSSGMESREERGLGIKELEAAAGETYRGKTNSEAQIDQPERNLTMRRRSRLTNNLALNGRVHKMIKLEEELNPRIYALMRCKMTMGVSRILFTWGNLSSQELNSWRILIS